MKANPVAIDFKDQRLVVKQDELWLHQARLLASSIKTTLRRGREKPQHAPHHLTTAIGLTETLIAHLKGELNG